MSRLLPTLTLIGGALFAAALPAQAEGKIQLVKPAGDAAEFRGPIELQVRTVLGPKDRLLLAPDVVIQNELGLEVHKGTMQGENGLYTFQWNDPKSPDGPYYLTINWHYLLDGQKQDRQSTNLTVGVRRNPSPLARLTLTASPLKVPAGEDSEISVKVVDMRGKAAAGVRVGFRTNQGELNSDAEITDSDGEAVVSLATEKEGAATVTATAGKLSQSVNVTVGAAAAARQPERPSPLPLALALPLLGMFIAQRRRA